MTHTTPAGIEAFLWFGDANDGGFVWFSMPGAKAMPEEVACSILVAFGQPLHPYRGGFSVGLS